MNDRELIQRGRESRGYIYIYRVNVHEGSEHEACEARRVRHLVQ